MTATDYDPVKFHDGLVKAGLIIPSGVQGVFARTAVFEDVVARFDAAACKLGVDDRAQALTFPPVIDRRLLEQLHYMDNFPQLAGVVYSFFDKELVARQLSEKIHNGEPWGDFLKMTDVSLTPAGCYPVYPTFRGTVPDEGKVVTLNSWVFRHEPSIEPTRCQAFRMREFVKVGSPDQVVEWRNAWLERGQKLLLALGLPAKSDIANDPFFGRGGKVMASSQRDLKLKFEVLIPVISADNPTACCSFNYHETKFGEAFEIKTTDGEVAHTACLGFGLERCAMALFQEHGFDPELWPREVRAILWP